MAQINTGVAGSAQPAVVDVVDFIDHQPVGRFQIGLLLTCAAVLFIDGFDTQAIGYVAPDLAREFNLDRSAMGMVFSAGLLGLMLGALTFGPIADRVGRKHIIIGSSIAFGLFTLATLFAHGITSLLAVRFLTGLGLGGAMPNAVALTSEFCPHRRRATMVMAMFCGFSVGAALGGLVAAALIPAFGWRSVFVVGGVAPFLLAPVLVLHLPESVRFLALNGQADERVREMLSSIAASTRFPPGTRFAVKEAKAGGLPVTHLFRDGRGWMTVLFWTVFFMSLLDLYLLSNWLPTVLNDLGETISAAAMIGAMLQIGGVVGAFTLGQFIDRFSFRALALIYLLAAFSVAAIGYSGRSIPLVTLAVFLAGFCVIGGQTASNALSAICYPTTARSTGVGWALGIGRLGSIVGPLIGGLMLSRHVGAETLFLAAAVPALCACASAFVLNKVALPAVRPRT